MSEELERSEGTPRLIYDQLEELQQLEEQLRAYESQYREGLNRLREATLEAILMEAQRKVLAGEPRDDTSLEERLAKIVPDQQLEEEMVKRVCARVMDSFRKALKKKEKRWKEKRRIRKKRMKAQLQLKLRNELGLSFG